MRAFAIPKADQGIASRLAPRVVLSTRPRLRAPFEYRIEARAARLARALHAARGLLTSSNEAFRLDRLVSLKIGSVAL
jgi:hypothetical protein